MKTKLISTSLAGLALTASLALPAHAERVDSIAVGADPAAHTITTRQVRRPYVFVITEKTRFVDARGTLLAVGLKVGDADVLTLAIEKGYLKKGSRLTVDFAQDGGLLAAARIQFRDMTRPAQDSEPDEKNPEPGDGNRQ